MKKPNLQNEYTSFVIEIKPTPTVTAKECATNPEPVECYEVEVPEAGASFALSVKADTKEPEVIEAAKRAAAAGIARMHLAALARGNNPSFETKPAPIGALKVQLRLPSADAVAQIVEQSAKTAR